MDQRLDRILEGQSWSHGRFVEPSSELDDAIESIYSDAKSNCSVLDKVTLVWGTPANFNGFRVLAALLHGSPVLGVSQTLRP